MRDIGAFVTLLKEGEIEGREDRSQIRRLYRLKKKWMSEDSESEDEEEHWPQRGTKCTKKYTKQEKTIFMLDDRWRSGGGAVREGTLFAFGDGDERSGCGAGGESDQDAEFHRTQINAGYTRR